MPSKRGKVKAQVQQMPSRITHMLLLLLLLPLILHVPSCATGADCRWSQIGIRINVGIEISVDTCNIWVSTENYDRFIMRQPTTAATAAAASASTTATWPSGCDRFGLFVSGSWPTEYAQDIDFRQVMRQLINHFFVAHWLGDYVAVATSTPPTGNRQPATSNVQQLLLPLTECWQHVERAAAAAAAVASPCILAGCLLLFSAWFC